MATVPLNQPRIEAPNRHLWIVAAFALLMCAAAGGYSLALHEIEALYLGIAAAGCVAVLIDFRLGALLLAFLLPVSGTSLFPHGLMGITGLNPINMMIAGTLLAFLLRGRVDHPGPLVPRPVWLYVVPIVAAGALGTLYVDDIHPGYFDQLVINYQTWTGYLRDVLIKPMIVVIAAILVAAAVAKARKPEPYVTAVIGGACLLALVMFTFVFVSEVRLGQLASPRARMFFATEIGTHANELGRTFVTAYALALFAWWETKHEPTRLALLAALGLVSFGIVLTFSRNAFLGFFLVNGLFLLWKFNMKKLGLAVLGTVVAAALAPDAVYRRLTYGFDGGANEVSAGRIDGIWLPLLPETLKSPLWGSGLDSILWSEAIRSGTAEFVGHPHNAYLEALLDMGLIGLALLLVFYWKVWKGFLALGSNPYLTPVTRGFFQGACAALVAFAVAGLSGGTLRPSPETVLLWMVIGMMFGLLARRPAG
jgi:hypothetical protein